MTEEELAKVPFQMVANLSMASEHACTYSSKDGRLGFCDHTPVIADFGGCQEYGRPKRHWRIDDKVYKSKKKFLEALKDFHPKMTMERLKEMQQ